MAKGLICDRCGAVITQYSQMNEIDILPYVGVKAVNQSKCKSVDLCKDCTKTLMQYINNEVQMVLFKDKGAANQPQEERYENTING